MLARVGIPSPQKRVDQYPHEFSGGMRQRAMTAMALVNDPKLLIADEPTTALDVTVQAQILDLMLDLQQEFKSAIIIITHDLGVVADVADLWALERANATHGRYHVLGATLSPLDGVGPQDLTIDALVARAHAAEVHEIILALNATVDGQTTAHYITDLLQDANVKVTRLAHGVPVGGELDYLDEGTLSAAMRQRTLF